MNGDLGTSDGPHATTTINEQGRILSHYLKSWNFVSAHLHLNTETSSHTYESESNSCISTIDHFLCPQHCLPFFSMCSTLSNLSTAANTSDHIPLVSEVTVPVQVSQPSATHSRGPTLNWKKLSDEEIKSTYTQLLESKLSTLSPPKHGYLQRKPTMFGQIREVHFMATASFSSTFSNGMYNTISTLEWQVDACTWH